MSLRIEKELAFVLHSRPFKETSLIVELLTKQYGKVNVIAKGARSQRAKSKYYLQPFLPVNISCYGKSDLLTLTHIEPSGPGYQLKKQALLSGIYMNELMIKLMRRHAAEPEIFPVYQQTLAVISGISEDEENLIKQYEQHLRWFEYQLLLALGYGFSWDSTADNHMKILSTAFYAFDPRHGFLDVSTIEGGHALVFPGEHLLAISCNNLSDPLVLRTAKQIMRVAISALLDGAILRSRELFL